MLVKIPEFFDEDEMLRLVEELEQLGLKISVCVLHQSLSELVPLEPVKGTPYLQISNEGGDPILHCWSIDSAKAWLAGYKYGEGSAASLIINSLWEIRDKFSAETRDKIIRTLTRGSRWNYEDKETKKTLKYRLETSSKAPQIQLTVPRRPIRKPEKVVPIKAPSPPSASSTKSQPTVVFWKTHKT